MSAAVERPREKRILAGVAKRIPSGGRFPHRFLVPGPIELNVTTRAMKRSAQRFRSSIHALRFRFVKRQRRSVHVAEFDIAFCDSYTKIDDFIRSEVITANFHRLAILSNRIFILLCGAASLRAPNRVLKAIDGEREPGHRGTPPPTRVKNASAQRRS
jgi:hypothetical protein